ncbi:MAG TPA: tRNA uridine-5-carboxymethylaminomethyl(34) synthesis GTPase MnmE [Alphaproteobacteria bacterium]|nr:tRNA uridine-5-carboxymethylaminomethyl(34) synthesis GTPase MnmE [Alphaproteobacteria bacterium]
MASSSADTVYALSSAPGKAGVAVLRVSGEKAGGALLALTGRQELSPPRLLQLAELKDAEGAPIDKAMAVFFRAPHSFTGEDVAEFHLHGSRAVVQAVSEALSKLGLRLAEPGEFTRRAVLNGKLDLVEAEGLADLIAAETESQRRQALRQMGGELSNLFEEWRVRLLRILAHVEADIDFPDEDLPAGLLAARIAEMNVLASEMETHLNDARRGERLRSGFSIAILGAPNAGKSSLINALARREAAIVSARAGTTRDVVEVHLDLAGYAVTLADTAGLREAADEIEQEGIRRAIARAQEADMKLVLFDAAEAPDEKSLSLLDEKSIAVLSKADIPSGVTPAKAGVHDRPEGTAQRHFVDARLPPALKLRRTGRGHDGVKVSSKTGEGVAELLNLITQRLSDWAEGKSAAPPLTRQRHREALSQALEALRRAAAEAHKHAPTELIAEELRHAAHTLGRITGRVDVEDLLDVIFRDFCLGK